MSPRSIACVCVLLVAVVIAPRRANVQAAPKTTSPTASVTFADGYSLYGDGSAYAEGSGISTSFHVGGSGDLTLNLLNSNRRFNGIVSCAGAVCQAPATTFLDGWFVNIHDIASMAPGETRWTQAAFIAEFGIKQSGKSGYQTHYSFSWCYDGSSYTGAFPPSPFSIAPLSNWCVGQQNGGSQMVSVLRSITGTPTWSVTSSSPISGAPVGPRAELEVTTSNTSSSLGLYNAGFYLTVACQSRCEVFPN